MGGRVTSPPVGVARNVRLVAQSQILQISFDQEADGPFVQRHGKQVAIFVERPLADLASSHVLVERAGRGVAGEDPEREAVGTARLREVEQRRADAESLVVRPDVQHQAKEGMNELQASFALGAKGSSDSEKYGERTVEFDTAGKPVTVTFEKNKAVKVTPGKMQ